MGAGRNLEHTPAAVVFLVFIFFLIVSYLIEQLFHRLEHYFEHHRLLGLKTALSKVKEELMLMGFCSLVLIVFEENILSICVNIRDVQGIPPQISTNCPCSYMYYRDFVEKPLHRARLLGSNNGNRSNVFEDVTGPTYQCRYKDGDCGPDWSVLMCCSNNENLRKKMGSGSMSGEECEIKYKLAAGATNVSGYKSSRLLWENSNIFSNRRLAGGDASSGCPAGTEELIHQAALHQTHTVIFFIAIVHITFGCLVMWTASRKVNKWALWETYGDDENEKPELLQVPINDKGHKRCLRSFFELFTQGVDPASYIAIRRFYISKNKQLHEKDPAAFQFNKRVAKHMNEKFGDILGIQTWMWLTLGIQIILEGYGLGILNIFTQIAFVGMIIIGCKLQMVNDHLTRHVYTKYNCITDKEHGKGCIDIHELIRMQVSRDFELFDDYEPQFWYNDPAIIDVVLKFCIWQISVSITLLLYFGIKFESIESFHTCYWESRTALRMIPDFLFMFGALVVAAFRVVPVHAVVSLSVNHNSIMTKRRLLKMGGHGHGHDDAHEDKHDPDDPDHTAAFSGSQWRGIKQRVSTSAVMGKMTTIAPIDSGGKD
jgi:hypothetical protein